MAERKEKLTNNEEERVISSNPPYKEARNAQVTFAKKSKFKKKVFKKT